MFDKRFRSATLDNFTATALPDARIELRSQDFQVDVNGFEWKVGHLNETSN